MSVIYYEACLYISKRLRGKKVRFMFLNITTNIINMDEQDIQDKIPFTFAENPEEEQLKIKRMYVNWLSLFHL